jgi:hypothetical protein
LEELKFVERSELELGVISNLLNGMWREMVGRVGVEGGSIRGEIGPSETSFNIEATDLGELDDISTPSSSISK